VIERDDDRACNEILSQGWIQFLDWKPQFDSTNNAARRWLDSAASADMPALFVADAQTAGRGRSDNRWWSPAGCLMLTLVIDGDMLPNDPAKWSQLALVCGVATAEAVAEFVHGPAPHPAPQLKWPNDVYLSERKCGGILIESGPSYQNDCSVKPSWLIGIGLNVDIDLNHAPTDVATRATCIRQHSSQSVAVPTVLVELVSRLRRWIAGWQSGELRWQDAWHERCLLSGQVVQIESSGGRVTKGLCHGVDDSGRLLVRGEHEVEQFSSAESIQWE